MSTIDKVKTKMVERHDELLKASKRYADEDAEGRYNILVCAMQTYCYDELGVSSNQLWHDIEQVVGEFLDLPEWLRI